MFKYNIFGSAALLGLLSATGLPLLSNGTNAFAATVAKTNGYSCLDFNSSSTAGQPIKIVFTDNSNLDTVVAACKKLMRELVLNSRRNFEVRYEAKLPQGWERNSLDFGTATTTMAIYKNCVGTFALPSKEQDAPYAEAPLELNLSVEINNSTKKVSSLNLSIVQYGFEPVGGGEYQHSVLFEAKNVPVAELLWTEQAGSFMPRFVMKPNERFLISTEGDSQKAELEEFEFWTPNGSDEIPLELKFRGLDETTSRQINWAFTGHSSPECFAVDISKLKAAGTKAPLE